MTPPLRQKSPKNASDFTRDDASGAPPAAEICPPPPSTVGLTTQWSCILILLFVAACVTVHPAQTSFNPFDVALSFYMNGALGWLLGLGLISLGAGSLLLCVAIGRSCHVQAATPCLMLLGLWGAGCIAGGVFPPDAYGQWNRPPSVAGLAHGIAAMVAFLSFPCAALSASRLLRLRDSRHSATLGRVAAGCAVMTVLLFVCLAPAFRHRPPYAFGLVERLALGGYVSWLLLANLVVRRVPTTQAE